MRRLPKKWVTCFLCEQFPGLSDMLNIWNKHNRESCHHVLYRLTGMNPADKVPSLSKDGLTKILRSRVAQYNLSPGRLGLSTQPLDWATQGMSLWSHLQEMVTLPFMCRRSPWSHLQVTECYPNA